MFIAFEGKLIVCTLFYRRILSNSGNLCSSTECNIVYILRPINASNLLDGGMVGAKYLENNKGWGVLRFAELVDAAGNAHGG